MWVVPTYNRPESLRLVLEQIKKVGCSSSIYIYVQGTERIDEYVKSIHSVKDFPSQMVIAYLPENIGLCGALNSAFQDYPNEPWYGTFGDDEYVYTEGWDTKLTDAARNCYISHGNDGIDSERRIRTYAVWGGDLLRSVGYWMPQGLWHWYSDDVWENLSNACNLRRWCQDVRTVNKHYIYGTAPKDKTYIMGESRSLQDKMVFEIWMRDEFPRVVERIKSGVYEVKA